MLKKSLLFGAVLFLSGILATACGDDASKEEIIRPVRYELVATGSETRTRTYSGTARSGTEIKLSFRVGGSIRAVHVVVGDRVAKGDLIANLDDTDARLNYERVEASLNKSRVQLETAQANLTRVRKLYENNNVPLSEYESAKERHANAAAARDADQRNLDLLARELAYFRLSAPMEGIITAKAVSANENVQAGQVVAVLETGDKMEVQVGVPEQSIARISKGQRVKVRFPAVNVANFDGTVSEVSYAIDKASSTYPVTVLLASVTEAVRPGMPAEVTFEYAADQTDVGLMVSANAVARDNDGTYVFVVAPAREGFGTVHKKRVSVSALTRQGFRLEGGLTEGELVVTAGIDKMYDGLKVRLLK
jgi:membrane fusion protein, multidrug efflux system